MRYVQTHRRIPQENLPSLPIVSHIIECPRVLNYQNGYPLRLVVQKKEDCSKDNGQGIDDEKGDIEDFFMTRYLLIIRNVPQPSSYVHMLSAAFSIFVM